MLSRTDQSLAKSLSAPDNIELKRSSLLSENKKFTTAQTDMIKTVKRSIDNGLQSRTPSYTAPTKNWRLSASYDGFVQVQQ
ncbi:MAG: hypothetical protein QM536_02925 [Chitinophagaceae bacterium]|nr:hypothetical protein [Chitinophagaceae bacterium]